MNLMIVLVLQRVTIETNPITEDLNKIERVDWMIKIIENNKKVGQMPTFLLKMTKNLKFI